MAPTAVPSLVQTVYMGYEHTIIYGYLNPSTVLTLKFLLKEFVWPQYQKQNMTDIGSVAPVWCPIKALLLTEETLAAYGHHDKC